MTPQNKSFPRVQFLSQWQKCNTTGTKSAGSNAWAMGTDAFDSKERWWACAPICFFAVAEIAEFRGFIVRGFEGHDLGMQCCRGGGQLQ